MSRGWFFRKAKDSCSETFGYDAVCWDAVDRFLERYLVDGVVRLGGIYVVHPTIRAADAARFLGISKAALRRKLPRGITERAELQDGRRGYLVVDVRFPLVEMLAAKPENRPGSHIVL